MSLPKPRSCFALQPGDIDRTLYRHRHAMQRTDWLSGAYRLVSLPCLLQGTLPIDAYECIKSRIQPFDLAQVGLNNFVR